MEGIGLYWFVLGYTGETGIYWQGLVCTGLYWDILAGTGMGDFVGGNGTGRAWGCPMSLGMSPTLPMSPAMSPRCQQAVPKLSPGCPHVPRDVPTLSPHPQPCPHAVPTLSPDPQPCPHAVPGVSPTVPVSPELWPFQALPFSSLGGHPRVALGLSLLCPSVPGDVPRDVPKLSPHPQPCPQGCPQAVPMSPTVPVSPELRPFQALPFSSLGAEPFALGGHPGVALAQPAAGACALLEWDQLGGSFRAQRVINGSSPVACHPVPLGDTLLLVVAQLGGGSWVWRRSGGPGSAFVRHQALGAGRLRRPHAVAAARLAGHLYLGVADSSKGGTSTVFRWASGGFYPHQALRPWQRDTHLEFLELGGRPALVLCGAARRPLVYRWSGDAFAPHTDIPHVPDAYAAKHFRLRGSVFLCLTRFLGDAKVMRWEGSMFREVQQVPARGSLVFQPLLLAGHRYVLLGNDFAPSRVFRLGAGGRLEPAQDLPAPTPRAFVPVAVGHRHFLVASSFKGATQIYAHVTEDVGT
uniref:Leucine rich repeat LGI family member 4 n=1 Tax=Taeniopygia guttata TaxID=59729 RepID=A0A674HLH7_TAEGU